MNKNKVFVYIICIAYLLTGIFIMCFDKIISTGVVFIDIMISILLLPGVFIGEVFGFFGGYYWGILGYIITFFIAFFLIEVFFRIKR